MSVNSLVSKIYINIKTNIKSYLGWTTLITFLYMYLFIATTVIIIFNRQPDPVIDYLKKLDSKTVTSFLLILTIFLTTLGYVFAKMKAPVATAIDRHEFFKRVYNYYPILPLFMIGIGFLLVTLSVFNNLFSTFGAWLFWGGVFLFYIMFLQKNYFESKIFYTLNKASKILNDIDPDNKKSDSINEFNKYFTKFLNNIDRNLKRGIKINNIKKEEDKISNPLTNMPIKNAIIHYLPVLIIYGNKEQIYSLKSHINKMLTLVKKNDEFDLNVSSILFDIYKDIEDFLHLNKYVVTEQRWRFKFSISNELLMVVGVTLSIVFKVLEFLISIYSK